MLGAVGRQLTIIPSSPTLPNGPCTGIPLPVCGSIIAVVGKEVKVQLPEDMQGDAAIGGRYIMIGFSEHGIEAV